MKSQPFLALVAFTVLACASCKKEIRRDMYVPVIRFQPTDSQKIRLIKEVTKVLEEVYENDSSWKEVNQAIFSKKYVDERILLAELLSSSAHIRFQQRFWKAVDKGRFHYIEQFYSRPRPRQPTNDMAVSGDVVVEPFSDIAIYFPYSDLFSTYNTPTLVAADRDADEAPGTEFYLCGIRAKPTLMCKREVMVNDDYAALKPTHIVTAGALLAVSPSTIPPASFTARVYHGWSRLSKQMDKLISFTGNGGGSEIKICRINGYLQTKDQQIDDFKGDVVTVHYSRSDIRKNRWKRIYSIWDPEWNYQDVEQIYAVYEEDTKGEKAFTGSLKTTVSLPFLKSSKVEADIGYKISVMTQDEIVTQRKIARKGYFNLSKIDQGYGYMQDDGDLLSGADWPIYDGGTIWAFTMPWQAR